MRKIEEYSNGYDIEFKGRVYRVCYVGVVVIVWRQDVDEVFKDFPESEIPAGLISYIGFLPTTIS